MATDYNLNLKANLDVSDAQQKLQQLGRVGTNATNSLEDAVRNLDQSIKQLGESWKKVAQEQSKAMQQQSHQRMMMGLIKGAGAHIAGNLLTQGERYFAATGNTGAATAAGYGASALRGAGWGAALGSVVPGLGTAAGAGIGAVAGMASEALDNLTKSAENAAKKIEEGMRAEDRSRQHYDNEMLRRMVEAIPGKGTSDLKERREFLMQDITDYRNLAAQGPSSTTAEGQIVYAQQLDYMKQQADIAQKEIAAIDAELKVRGEWYDSAAEIAQLQQEEAEAIKQRIEEEKKIAAAFEAQKAQEEKTTQDAASLLTTLTKEESAEKFTAGLQDMSPGELVKTIDELKAGKEELRSKAMAAAAEAMDTGDTSKYTDAENYYEQLKEVTGRLAEAESVLGGISINSGGALKDYFEGAMGDEGAKGYDTGQYGSLENAIMKQNLDNTKQIKDGVNEIKGTLKDISNTTTLVKDKLNDNGTVGIYGGP